MGIEEITITPLEKVTDTTASPTTECLYPQCERCSRYVGYGGTNYCTVPIVVNKQNWLITASKLRRLEKCIAELQTALYDHILGVTEPSNMLVCANCTHLKEPDYCELQKMKVTPDSYCDKGSFKP